MEYIRLYRIKLKRIIENNDLVLASSIVVTLIIIATFIGWYNNRVVPIYPKTHFHYTLEPNNPLKFLSNWDGPDYLSIASHGYHNIKDVNFFPLYPILIRLVNFVVPSLLMSALTVAWLSLLGAVYFFIKITRHLYSLKKLEVVGPLLYFILFPSAIFLIATYTESLYAFLALSAVYFAFKKKPIYAAVSLALCTATHITGIFVVILVALILVEQRQKILHVLACALFGCLGLVSYMVYLKAKFSDPLLFIKAQREIHGWQAHSYSGLFNNPNTFSIILVLLIIVSAIYWWNKRKSFAIYSLLFLLIPLLGKQFGGFNRYALMAFPLQLMLYEYFKSKKTLSPYILIILSTIWALFMLEYAAGYIGS